MKQRKLWVQCTMSNLGFVTVSQVQTRPRMTVAACTAALFYRSVLRLLSSLHDIADTTAPLKATADTPCKESGLQTWRERKRGRSSRLQPMHRQQRQQRQMMGRPQAMAPLCRTTWNWRALGWSAAQI